MTDIEALRASKGATYIKYELLHAELAKSKAQAERLAEALREIESVAQGYVKDVASDYLRDYEKN